MLKVLLGVCGGISAYKSVYLASLLKKKSFEVRVVMTENACRFVTPLTFMTITGSRVYTTLWEDRNSENHTSISEWADIAVIAPATANTIAKIALGIADNLLTSFVLDYTGPVFIVPAMHENMWNNSATKINVERLRKTDNFHIFNPDTGDLAGGKKGVGRMVEPDNIMEKVLKALDKYPEIRS